MSQSSSSALPDVLARRLMQEQELQQVIVDELMRRKLLERSATDSHKFILDPRHNTHVKRPLHSVFNGIIGKSVGYQVDSQRGSVQTEKRDSLTLSNLKVSSLKTSHRHIKVNSKDKLRRERLQDILLEEQLEQSISSASVSCDKKQISPRKERENLNIIMAPRRHVLRLNLGALMTSPATEQHRLISPRGSFTERCHGDASHFGVAFASARNTRFDQPPSILDLKPSIQVTVESDSKQRHEIKEAPISHESTLGAGTRQCDNISLAKFPVGIKRYSQRSKALFSPDTPRICGSSVPSTFLRKVHSLRSILTNPVSCHVPNAPDPPFMRSHSLVQSTFCNQECLGDVQDWNVLISKYPSQISKPKLKT